MPIRPDSVLQLDTARFQNGHILLVDDEPDIRRLMHRVLRERDFSVLEAGDGEEALAQIARHPIRLIISNIRMPHLSGLSLYAHLAELCPTLASRIVFCSGDIAGEESHRFLQRTEAPWLIKPFDLDDLLDLVTRHCGAPIQVDAATARQIEALVSRRRGARVEWTTQKWAGQA
jgi:CheY-like chemotaxis protein